MADLADWRDLVPAPSSEFDARIRADIADVKIADNPQGSEDRRLAALALHGFACRSGHGGYLVGPSRVRALASAAAGWTREDLVWSLYTAAHGSIMIEATEHFELPGVIAAILDPREWTDLRSVFEGLFHEVVHDYHLTAEGRRVVVSIVGRALDRLDGGFPRALLRNGDHFGRRIRSALADELRAPGVAGLLLHCASLTRPAPSGAWLATLNKLLDAAPTGRVVVREVLDSFATSVGAFHDDTDSLVRGLIWALSEQDIELLARVTVTAGSAPASARGYPPAPRAALVGVAKLAKGTGDTPLRTLARMSLTVKNKTLNKRVQQALTELGALRGWSASEVMELSVPDHDLGPDGRLVTKLGAYEAIVAIDGGKARLNFACDGKAIKTMPAALKDEHAADITALKGVMKEVNATLATERQRVEGLLSESREWSYPDWIARLLEHPVTACYGRRLIYETTVDGAEWMAGLPRLDADGWNLVGPDGTVRRGDQIRLWHPIRCSAEEVLAWRQHIMAAELDQPFKQAFREVYLLTPAEEQTSTYSNRFAGHILRYRQANALMRVRGWQAGYLGSWDGGGESDAIKDFGGGQWRALFAHAAADAGDAHLGTQYCSTDQVRFECRDGAVTERVSVMDVPAVVFSEAMRDVDLFIGVTSIAADPEWLDRGDDRYRTYWHSTAFGGLTASAEVRRDALARVLPRTKIADRVELGDRFLRVQGKVRTYKIHLGSGNILMEPNDAYLCIVASRSKTGTVRLPFDEDAILSAILSKAILLAADDKITDPTILSQLR